MEKVLCDQEWVRQELILWEEGINARIAALRAEVVSLAERLERLELSDPRAT